MAALLGWSHLRSIRGQSLIGALTLLVKVARDWRTWLPAVSLYTLTGRGVTLAIGAGIGEVGRVAGLASRPVLGLTACLAIALVLAARELGILRFRLPERPLQTEKVWMHHWIGKAMSVWVAPPAPPPPGPREPRPARQGAHPGGRGTARPQFRSSLPAATAPTLPAWDHST